MLEVQARYVACRSKGLCEECPLIVLRARQKSGKMVTRYKIRKGYTRNEALDVRVDNLALKQLARPNYEKMHAWLLEQAKLLLDDPGAKVSGTPRKRRVSMKKRGKSIAAQLDGERDERI